MPHPKHTLGAEGAHGRLHSSQKPRKCSCSGTLLMSPILGILAKVMIHKMGRAKGGLPTAYGNGPKLLTGGSSFTLPSNGRLLNTPGTSPQSPHAIPSAYNALHFSSWEHSTTSCLL